MTTALKGKAVLITGGARGLGAEFALACCEAGARVAIADIRDEEGRETAQRLRVGFVHLDLGDPAAVEHCARAAVAELGGIDGLVNCGAVTDSGGRSLEQLDIETWDRVMNVNVRGTWLMTRAALPWLKAAKSGRVVNIASDTALWGAPLLLAYVASKGAVIAMTRAMARELGEHEITVNTVAPGLTVLAATEHVPAARHEQYRAGRAIQRAQRPEDASGAVVFLLSDAAAFVTGQVLAVNGGFVFN